MSRQHIDIGSTPNDGTGDVPRIAWDKANDNFIELYTMFDDWPGNFDYWPLGGPADLSAAVTIDGNNFDLIFGSPNSLNSFEIFAGGSHLHLSSDIELITNNYSITGSVFSATLDSQIIWDLDDGIDQATFDLTSSLFNLTVPQMSFNNSIAMDIAVDDGVDSSSFSLTPTGASFDRPVGVGSYTVATLPSATGAARIIYVSDESGGPIIAFSDNTNWRRVTDGSIVS